MKKSITKVYILLFFTILINSNSISQVPVNFFADPEEKDVIFNVELGYNMPKFPATFLSDTLSSAALKLSTIYSTSKSYGAKNLLWIYKFNFNVIRLKSFFPHNQMIENYEFTENEALVNFSINRYYFKNSIRFAFANNKNYNYFRNTNMNLWYSPFLNSQNKSVFNFIIGFQNGLIKYKNNYEMAISIEPNISLMHFSGNFNNDPFFKKGNIIGIGFLAEYQISNLTIYAEARKYFNIANSNLIGYEYLHSNITYNVGVHINLSKFNFNIHKLRKSNLNALNNDLMNKMNNCDTCLTFSNYWSDKPTGCCVNSSHNNNIKFDSLENQIEVLTKQINDYYNNNNIKPYKINDYIDTTKWQIIEGIELYLTQAYDLGSYSNANISNQQTNEFLKKVNNYSTQKQTKIIIISKGQVDNITYKSNLISDIKDELLNLKGNSSNFMNKDSIDTEINRILNQYPINNTNIDFLHAGLSLLRAYYFSECVNSYFSQKITNSITIETYLINEGYVSSSNSRSANVSILFLVEK